MLKYIDYLSRLLMIAPVLIIGFKLDAATVSIFVLATGVLLRIIYSKMKKDKSHHKFD